MSTLVYIDTNTKYYIESPLGVRKEFCQTSCRKHVRKKNKQINVLSLQYIIILLLLKAYDHRYIHTLSENPYFITDTNAQSHETCPLLSIVS